MPFLTQQSLKAFYSRFGHCYDGKVVEININLRGKKDSAHLVMETKDQDNEFTDGWADLHLDLLHLSDWRMIENQKEYFRVLSDGVAFYFSEKLVCVDLGGQYLHKNGIDRARKYSPCYFAAKKLQWVARPCCEKNQARKV